MKELTSMSQDFSKVLMQMTRQWLDYIDTDKSTSRKEAGRKIQYRQNHSEYNSKVIAKSLTGKLQEWKSMKNTETVLELQVTPSSPRKHQRSREKYSLNSAG